MEINFVNKEKQREREREKRKRERKRGKVIEDPYTLSFVDP
jgi:hypothetical protein